MNILTDSILSWATFWVAVASAAISLGSLVFAYIAYKATKNHDNKAKIDLAFDKVLNPISSIMYDALIIFDKEQYIDTNNLDKQDELLLAGFHHLYYYAKAQKLKYLEDYANINSGGKEKNKLLFAYNFLILENEYLEFRKQHTSGKPTNDEIEKLGNYINDFKNAIDLSSKYSLIFLFRKHIVRRSVKKAFYKKLKKLSK